MQVLHFWLVEKMKEKNDIKKSHHDTIMVENLS